MSQPDANPISTNYVIALAEHGVLERAAFWQRVHGLSAVLAAHPAHRWALVCQDGAWFAAGLLALARSGRTCIVPQAPQAGSLAASGAQVDAVLTDRPAEFSQFTTLAITEAPTATDAGVQWPDDDARIEFYTSGSSGTPKCVVHRLGQMRREAEVLEREWGARLGDAIVLGTVPHYHRYGLQVRLIWPLFSARPFVTSTCLQPADLRRWASRHTCVITSSPAFLSRLRDPAELPPAARVAAIFSSGAPLPDPCAEGLLRDWGQSPIEIYGSTETGGVAWRAWSGAAERPYWQLLNSVQVELREEPAGTRLWVKSPYTWDADWMATGDLARRHGDGRFTLLGRADDVVKFEDKRVSLAEMRNRLMTHPWVQDARLLLLAGRRQVIGAVVILNAEGHRQLGVQEKPVVSRTLRNWLCQSYEPVLVPRKWRFPESLPDNDMGKVALASLRELFAPPMHGLPTVLAERRDGSHSELDLLVGVENPWFQGHFPGHPILPGVVQIGWAVHYAGAASGMEGEACALEQIKFRRPILPGARLTLRLTPNPEKLKLKFEYRDAEYCYSSGTLNFRTGL